MSITSRIAFAALCLTFLAGASDCPITVNQEGGEGPGGGGGEAGLDLGGAAGAVWQVTMDDEVTVVLRAFGAADAQTVPLQGGAVSFAGGVVDLGSFCWRSDVVCPHQVLLERTTLVQPADWPGAVLASFNPRGPLAAFRAAGALGGQLSGQELVIPLGGGQSEVGTCQLGPASMILATAAVGAGADAEPWAEREADAEPGAAAAVDRSDRLTGRITLSYTGTCINLGSGAVEPEARVELSVGFSAERE